MKFYSCNLKATIGGREYEWFGGFGSILVSYERGIHIGDVRIIGDTIFFCYSIEWGFWKNRINWSIPGDLTANTLRKIKRAIFDE